MVARADVNPLPAGWGPDLLPAIVPVPSVAVKERSANKCKIAEMAMMPDAGPIIRSANETQAAAFYSGAEAGSRRDDCRPNRSRGNASKKFGRHVIPPCKPATQALCMLAK